MSGFKSLAPRRTSVPERKDEIVNPFLQFRREMDRMFDDFFGEGGRFGLFTSGQDLVPVVDVADSDKEVIVTAELPGVKEEDIDVTLSGDVLTIKGEKKSEHEKKDGARHYVERSYGSFARSVRLPFEVKDEQIGTQFEKGVLTLRFPKPAAQKSVRKIEVKKKKAS